MTFTAFGVELPPVGAKGTVAVTDFGNGTSGELSTNIARFLQTISSSPADPNGKILIKDEDSDVPSTSINFDTSENDFITENEASLTAVILAAAAATDNAFSEGACDPCNSNLQDLNEETLDIESQVVTKTQAEDHINNNDALKHDLLKYLIPSPGNWTAKLSEYEDGEEYPLIGTWEVDASGATREEVDAWGGGETLKVVSITDDNFIIGEEDAETNGRTVERSFISGRVLKEGQVLDGDDTEAIYGPYDNVTINAANFASGGHTYTADGEVIIHAITWGDNAGEYGIDVGLMEEGKGEIGWIEFDSCDTKPSLTTGINAINSFVGTNGCDVESIGLMQSFEPTGNGSGEGDVVGGIITSFENVNFVDYMFPLDGYSKWVYNGETTDWQHIDKSEKTSWEYNIEDGEIDEIEYAKWELDNCDDGSEGIIGAWFFEDGDNLNVDGLNPENAEDIAPQCISSDANKPYYSEVNSDEGFMGYIYLMPAGTTIKSSDWTNESGSYTAANDLLVVVDDIDAVDGEVYVTFFEKNVGIVGSYEYYNCEGDRGPNGGLIPTLASFTHDEISSTIKNACKGIEDAFIGMKHVTITEAEYNNAIDAATGN